MANVMDTASEIIQEAEAPCKAYPFAELQASARAPRLRCDSLTERTRAASPVVPAPGVGQVGLGLENSWGLEEDADEEEEEGGREEETKTEEQHRERKQGSGGLFL